MFLTKLYKFYQAIQVVPNCCRHNTRYMCYSYCGIVLQRTYVLCCGDSVACCATHCIAIAILAG